MSSSDLLVLPLCHLLLLQTRHVLHYFCLLSLLLLLLRLLSLTLTLYLPHTFYLETESKEFRGLRGQFLPARRTRAAMGSPSNKKRDSSLTISCTWASPSCYELETRTCHQQVPAELPPDQNIAGVVDSIACGGVQEKLKQLFRFLVIMFSLKALY